MALSPGEVKTEHISTGAVTTPKIADEAVVAVKIKDGAVKTEKIATGAVTGSKIGEGQVYGSKLRDGAVRSEKIASGAVTTAKIGELSVTTSRLQDKSVTTDKLASGAVSTEKIAQGAVTPAKLSFVPPSIARPITPPITSVELGVGSVESDKIAAGVITASKLATDSVETTKIKDGAVTPAKLSFVPTAFVPRTAAAPDKTLGDFIIDGGWHTDALDLSSIIPVGAKAVVIDLTIMTYPNVGAALLVATDINVYPDNRAQIMSVFSGKRTEGHFILPCEPDRLFDYAGTPVIDQTLNLTVIGWFI